MPMNPPEEDYFTKCDEWLTGIASLDAQHTELAGCIREIDSICCYRDNMQSGNPLSMKQQLSVLLDKLYQVTKRHFKYEEAVMLESGYPNYAAHRREHNLMLAEMKLIIKDHTSGKNEVDPEMARGLKVWFIAHVKLSDCKFSAYLSTHRLARD